MNSALVTVYRVENERGHGPYYEPGERIGYPNLHGPDSWCDMSRHPTPDREGWTHATIKGKVFGFTSKAKALAWFEPDARAILNHKGFKLRMFKVPASDVIEAPSRQQAVFVRHSQGEEVSWDE